MGQDSIRIATYNPIKNKMFTVNDSKQTIQCGNKNTTNVPLNNNSQPVIEKRQRASFDFDETYDKYKKNPQEAITALGIEYTEEQLKELKNLVTDKKSLKIFLRIAGKTNLNAEDTIAAFKNVLNQKASNIFKRGWTWLTNGFKTERECNAETLSTNMHEIREVRGKELSTQTVLRVGEYIGKDENKKTNAMHFVRHRGPKGEFLYSENNINNAINYMQENPDKTNEFIANVTDLESIKNEKGEPRYNGDTNISVGTRMTNNPELAQTMKRVAHKLDMTNEYLENITGNLEKNPHMQGAIDYSLNAKNQDGTDRFSANSINMESNQLVDKNESFCNEYTKNLEKLSQYSHITPEDLVKIVDNVTKNPEIISDVISKIENGTMTSKEIAEYTENIAQNKSVNEAIFIQPESKDESNSNEEIITQNNEQQETRTTQAKQKIEAIDKYLTETLGLKPIKNAESIESIDNETTIKINGVVYSEKAVIEKLKINFGALTDTILEAIKKDPRNIEIIKQYNGNPKIIKAYLENPELIEKIKTVGGVLTNSELSDVLELCTNGENTALMLMAMELGGATNAIKTTRYAQITGSKEDAMDILSNRTLSCIAKKQQLESLYGQEKKSEYIA